MKNLLLILISFLILHSSCSKQEEPQEDNKLEITTIDSIGHSEATELLRLNILSKYGGAFRVIELYHNKTFNDGLPCDSSLEITLQDENLPTFSLHVPMEVSTNCQANWGVYNDRFYRGHQRNGTQTAESNIFGIEVLLNDQQTIAGNWADEVYTYSQNGLRSILISKGISPELDPEARLFLLFSLCQYDHINIQITGETEIIFDLEIRTIEGSMSLSRKSFEGIIRLIDNDWTVFYADGVIEKL